MSLITNMYDSLLGGERVVEPSDQLMSGRLAALNHNVIIVPRV